MKKRGRERTFFRRRKGEMVYVRGNFCGKGCPPSRCPQPPQVTKLCSDPLEGRNFQIKRQKPASNLFPTFSLLFNLLRLLFPPIFWQNRIFSYMGIREEVRKTSANVLQFTIKTTAAEHALTHVHQRANMLSFSVTLFFL